MRCSRAKRSAGRVDGSARSRLREGGGDPVSSSSPSSPSSLPSSLSSGCPFASFGCAGDSEGSTAGWGSASCPGACGRVFSWSLRCSLSSPFSFVVPLSLAWLSSPFALDVPDTWSLGGGGRSHAASAHARASENKTDEYRTTGRDISSLEAFGSRQRGTWRATTHELRIQFSGRRVTSQRSTPTV